MSDLVTWLDVFTIIGVLVVSGWLMRGITFFIEYRRRKYLEPMPVTVTKSSMRSIGYPQSEQTMISPNKYHERYLETSRDWP